MRRRLLPPRNRERMRSVTTTSCRLHGQPEVTLAFDPNKVLERDALWFTGVIERDVEGGARFQVGQSMQIGWMWAWFTVLPDGTYGFEEPDMKSATPLVRQAGLTNSLGHLRFQKDTLESVLSAEELSFPSIQQTCIVCTRFPSSGAFFVERREPKDNDSGWIFGCLDSDHDHQTKPGWQKSWLYSAVVAKCRPVLPYLAFPPGSVINVDKDGSPEFYLRDKRLLVRKDSYVHRLMERPKRDAY